MDALREIVCACNIYIREQRSPNTLLLTDIAVYVTHILHVFGAIDTPDTIGFPIAASSMNGAINVSSPIYSFYLLFIFFNFYCLFTLKI